MWDGARGGARGGGTGVAAAGEVLAPVPSALPTSRCATVPAALRKGSFSPPLQKDHGLARAPVQLGPESRSPNSRARGPFSPAALPLQSGVPSGRPCHVVMRVRLHPAGRSPDSHAPPPPLGLKREPGSVAEHRDVSALPQRSQARGSDPISQASGEMRRGGATGVRGRQPQCEGGTGRPHCRAEWHRGPPGEGFGEPWL